MALINSPIEHVKFVEYTGRYPNLCLGLLTLEINGKRVTFGCDYDQQPNVKGDYDSFWISGGYCVRNPEELDVVIRDWFVDADLLPVEYKQYSFEIYYILNQHVKKGCCGGCLYENANLDCMEYDLLLKNKYDCMIKIDILKDKIESYKSEISRLKVKLVEIEKEMALKSQ